MNDLKTISAEELKINEEDFQEIRDVFEKYLKGTGAVVYAFGSRVRGTTKKYADLDTAIDFNGEKLPEDKEIRIKNGLDDTYVSFRVDVVDWNNISDDFKKSIMPDLRKLFVLSNYSENAPSLRNLL
jgi:predicted nucleotidyltransferase